MMREQRQPKRNRRNEKDRHRNAFAPGDPGAERRDERTPEQRHRDQQDGKRQLDKIDCAKADRVIERRECLE